MTHAKLYIYRQESAKEQFVASEITKHHIHSTDLITLDEDSIGIAQIRKLKLRIAQKPFTSPFTLVVLAAEALTIEAQQALLKTLEEPPALTKLLIVTPKRDLLLPTIQSRLTIIYEQTTQNALPDLTHENIWHEIFHSSVGQRFKSVDQLLADRGELITWLTEALKYYRLELLHNMQKKPIHTALSAKQLQTVLHTISYTISLLNANVAVKLALDFLLINSPYIQ